MKMKRILGLVLTGILLLGALGACTPSQVTAPSQQPAEVTDSGTAVPPTPGDAAPPPPGQTIGRGVTMALTSETPSVAPTRHTTLIGQFKNMLTHNGIIRLCYDTHVPLPDLVTGWRAVSDTEWEFTLIEGILFHNGEEMTADDIVASIYYVRTHPENRAIHRSVVGARAVDRYTFILDTGEPNAQVLFDLTHHSNFIMPKSLIDAGHDFTVDPIGSGPFVFDDWRLGDSLTFKIFEDYFDTERFPRIEYVTWRIIPEGASRTIALETGEVDFVVDVAFPDIPRMEANSDITVVQRPGLMYSYLILNNDRPQFESIHVRHAIDMALDRDAMLMASLDGFGVSTRATMPMMLPGATMENTREFDPEGARTLLAEHNIDPATLGFEMLAFNEEQRRRGEVVQSNLADIGIATTITMIDFAAWLPLTMGDNFEASFANLTPSSMLSFMRDMMHIDFIDSQNRSRMRHQELSDLITEAFATIDEGARVAILEEAARLSNEHAGYIGTNTNIIVRAFNSNLVVPEIGLNAYNNINMFYWAE